MTSDHRRCCPWLYPDSRHPMEPGETWTDWYRRVHGAPWWGFVGPHGWPMEGVSYGACICPTCIEGHSGSERTQR